MLNFERTKQKLQAPGASPLYQRLHEAIQAQIRDGTLQAGDSLPAERTLQETLGVSRSTIRQAVKLLIDQKLLKSVVGSGNFVLEQTITPPENSLVAVVTPDSHFHVYYADLASFASTSLGQAGLRVDMSLHNGSWETMERITASLIRQHGHALILASSGLEEQKIKQMVTDLQSRGVVVVMIARYYPELTTDYVGVDNEGIGYQATRHLLELDHRGVVYFGAPYFTAGLDRAGGYVRAMQESGFEPAIFVPPGEPKYPDCEFCSHVVDFGVDILWKKVQRGEITGIVCFNDTTAGWVQREIRNLNLVIPRHLSLVGVDNLPYAEFFDAPLTTFALPGAEIGKAAAGLVLRRLAGDVFSPQHLLIPAHFIRRLSTALPNRDALASRILDLNS